ncbi:hypothetical protein GCM10008983_15970 [Lentibacillus halophilus]|uniref:Small, acid-soluble spore protein L n=1 Tax=Lentibacillus halophilus TaxID=295065 RepID=A0ABN0Z9S9_9BACI
MADKQDNWKSRQVKTSINKQGLSEDASDQQPDSQLEQRAKKKNTKI